HLQVRSDFLEAAPARFALVQVAQAFGPAGLAVQHPAATGELHGCVWYSRYLTQCVHGEYPELLWTGPGPGAGSAGAERGGAEAAVADPAHQPGQQLGVLAKARRCLAFDLPDTFARYAIEVLAGALECLAAHPAPRENGLLTRSQELQQAVYRG